MDAAVAAGDTAVPSPTAGGLRVDGPGADGGTGELRAGSLDGQPVLVRRLSLVDDTGLTAHAVLLARQLVGVEHPALLPVLAARADGDGIDLVCPRPDVDCSLAGLLSRRRLEVGEVLGLGLAVGDALASLHRAGLCHGRLSAADLLVRPDGSVLLAGHGVAGVLGSAGSPEEDVADLVELLGACLADLERPDVERLRRELEHLGADPRRTAEDLLATLTALPVPVEPIRLPGHPSPPVHRHLRRPRRRWWWPTHAWRMPQVGWRVLGAGLPAAAGVLLLAGWLGASLPDPAGAKGEAPAAGPDGGAPAAAPPVPAEVPASTPPLAPPRRPKPVTTDWTAVVNGLDDARSRLFAAPSEDRLGTVDAPGSSAYAADRALVRDLVASGAAGSGLRTEVRSVAVRSAGAQHAELTVVDVLRPYTIVSTGAGSGRVLQSRLGRPSRTTDVVLVRSAGQWRVAEVRPG